MKKKQTNAPGGNLFPIGVVKNNGQAGPPKVKQAIGATVQPNMIAPPKAKDKADGRSYDKQHETSSPHNQPKPGAGPISRGVGKHS